MGDNITTAQRRAMATLGAFRRADRTFKLHEGDAVRAHDLTPAQFGVLEVLHHAGPLRVSEITEKMLATPGNMTVVIRNMIRDGLIEKTPDPADRRNHLVTLTSQGTKVIVEVFPEHARVVEGLFSSITEEERKELFRILRKIYKAGASTEQ